MGVLEDQWREMMEGRLEMQVNEEDACEDDRDTIVF
jgi:hypothetical protein